MPGAAPRKGRGSDRLWLRVYQYLTTGARFGFAPFCIGSRWFKAVHGSNAWKVSAMFDPSITAELLLNAASGLIDQKPTLLVDGGVENFNSAVDELVDSGLEIVPSVVEG